MKEGVSRFTLGLCLCGIGLLLLSCTDEQEKAVSTMLGRVVSSDAQLAVPESEKILAQIEEALKSEMAELEPFYKIVGPIPLQEGMQVAQFYTENLEDRVVHTVETQGESLYFAFIGDTLFAQENLVYYFIFNEANILTHTYQASWWPTLLFNNKTVADLGEAAYGDAFSNPHDIHTTTQEDDIHTTERDDETPWTTPPEPPPSNACCPSYKKHSLSIELFGRVFAPGDPVGVSIVIDRFTDFFRNAGFTTHAEPAPLPPVRNKEYVKGLIESMAQFFDPANPACQCGRDTCCGEFALHILAHGSVYKGEGQFYFPSVKRADPSSPTGVEYLSFEPYAYTELARDLNRAFQGRCLNITILLHPCYAGSALPAFSAQAPTGPHCPVCVFTGTDANHVGQIPIVTNENRYKELDACVQEFYKKYGVLPRRLHDIWACFRKKVLRSGAPIDAIARFFGQGSVNNAQKQCR